MVRRRHFCVGHAQVARWSQLRLIGKPAGLYLADADPVFHRTLPMSSAYSGSVSRRVQFYLQVDRPRLATTLASAARWRMNRGEMSNAEDGLVGAVGIEPTTSPV